MAMTVFTVRAVCLDIPVCIVVRLRRAFLGPDQGGIANSLRTRHAPGASCSITHTQHAQRGVRSKLDCSLFRRRCARVLSAGPFPTPGFRRAGRPRAHQDRYGTRFAQTPAFRSCTERLLRAMNRLLGNDSFRLEQLRLAAQLQDHVLDRSVHHRVASNRIEEDRDCPIMGTTV